MNTIGIFKIILGLVLAVNALTQIFARETWWFIQNVNLIFHEAGHIIFMFFGDFLSILGGSLLEILIPLMVVLHFIFTKQLFSAVVASWWLATAFVSVSIYASDAQERLLPLLGGDAVIHDWYDLLGSLGILQYDDVVGYIFWCCSLLTVAILFFLLTKDKDVQQLLFR